MLEIEDIIKEYNLELITAYDKNGMRVEELDDSTTILFKISKDTKDEKFV